VIENTWKDFNSVASKLKPDECKVIEIQKRSIGFFIRTAAKTNATFFYQMGNGECYIPGEDYVYSVKSGDVFLPKEAVVICKRQGGDVVGTVFLKPFDTIQNVKAVVSSFGKFEPADISLYYESGWAAHHIKPSVPPKKIKDKTSQKPQQQQQQQHTKASESAPSSPILTSPPFKPPADRVDYAAKREGTVLVPFTWAHPGSSVEVTGSFSGWKQRYKLHNEGNVFLTRLYLPPGTYQYKFVVDGTRWCYDSNKPCLKDPSGNVNNQITVVGHFDSELKNQRIPKSGATVNLHSKKK
jgi:hypothetical protein